jgi:hypothetical protein
MRRFLLGTLSFLIACCIPFFGCECGPPGHASRYLKGASTVFVGRVVFTNDDGSGQFTQKTLVHFEVEEAYKGVEADVHDVWIDPGSFTSCYAEYRVAERYLVFAYGGAFLPRDSPAMSVAQGESKAKHLPPGIDSKNPPKVYVAPECSGTRPITPETKRAVSRELEYLRKFKASPENTASTRQEK